SALIRPANARIATAAKLTFQNPDVPDTFSPCLVTISQKMKTRLLLIIAIAGQVWAQAQTDPLGTPRFHHLHLNSTDPEAAIAFYTRQFPTTSRTTFAGAPALQSPNNVLVLFTKVSKAAALEPQTAVWEFGWHVTDVRKNVEMYKQRPDV